LAVADASDAEQRAAVARAAASGQAEITRSANGEQVLWLAVAPPPSLVLCGGGPDAIPVAELARFLGWQVIVFDHRAGYARADRFARGVRVLQQRPAPLAQLLGKERVAAAVIMSHHLETDQAWLKVLADAMPAYVGLLGPAPRREKLLNDLSPAQRVALTPRLHAPVGLDLGGRTPEEIALAIVAQIQAKLHGRDGRPFDWAKETRPAQADRASVT
jgi:xanthine/CO dehydrogenase XdhC/CoxF family maturation factor